MYYDRDRGVGMNSELFFYYYKTNKRTNPIDFRNTMTEVSFRHL